MARLPYGGRPPSKGAALRVDPRVLLLDQVRRRTGGSSGGWVLGSPAQYDWLCTTLADEDAVAEVAAFVRTC